MDGMCMHLFLMLANSHICIQKQKAIIYFDKNKSDDIDIPYFVLSDEIDLFLLFVVLCSLWQ